VKEGCVIRGLQRKKPSKKAGGQVLEAQPVILATQEAEIRRIVVQSQPEQIVHETRSQEYPTQNRAGGVAQVVEPLPRKCEAQSLKPQ
jgi:hypothetical protein